MKRLFLSAVLASTFLTGCGNEFKGDRGPQGPQGPSAPTPTPTPPPTIDQVQLDIDEMISQKNQDRAILAQAPLTNGLSCSVQEVTGGQCLTYNSAFTNGCTTSTNLLITSGVTYTYLYKGSFNQPNSSSSSSILLLPPALRSIFAGKNFKIICTGQIVVLESNYYDFTLNSDDGSLLYLNGSLIVNNDANHGMAVKSGSALLYRGVQSFQIQYAQSGGGNFGLILQSGGTQIDPKFLYH